MYYATTNGVEKRVESWKLVVPLYDNEGKRFRNETIESIKSSIITEFGGLAAISTVGSWKSGEQVFHDKNTTIIVDIPVKNHEKASAFFVGLKEKLRKELRQEKIYITYEREGSELLSVNEFLQELGFEIPSEQPQLLLQEEINRLVEQSPSLQRREGYKTLKLERDNQQGIVVWERQVLGIRISTKIKDTFPKDAVILAADNLESYFKKGVFGKPLVVLGDYEFQSFILDKEKRRHILQPESFLRYNEGNEETRFHHDWHGVLNTSEFILTYIEELLTNYIILRDLGALNERITIVVGTDGSVQTAGGTMLRCPAYIPDKDIQIAIIDGFIQAKNMYENKAIDDVALMQIKVLNRYNEKKAMIEGSRNLMSS
jgi:hypothetical protein